MLLIYTVRIVRKFCEKFYFKLTTLYIGIKQFTSIWWFSFCQPKKRTENLGLKVVDVGKL